MPNLTTILVALMLAACAASPSEPPPSGPVTGESRPGSSVVRVVALQHVAAGDLVATIAQLLEQDGSGELRITAHEATNSVLVQAPPARAAQVLRLVEQLDSDA